MNRAGALLQKDMKKVKLLNACFVLVLLVRFAFRNLKSLRPVKKSAAMNTYSLCRRTMLGKM